MRCGTFHLTALGRSPNKLVLHQLPGGSHEIEFSHPYGNTPIIASAGIDFRIACPRKPQEYPAIPLPRDRQDYSVPVPWWQSAVVVGIDPNAAGRSLARRSTLARKDEGDPGEHYLEGNIALGSTPEFPFFAMPDPSTAAGADDRILMRFPPNQLSGEVLPGISAGLSVVHYQLWRGTRLFYAQDRARSLHVERPDWTSRDELLMLMAPWDCVHMALCFVGNFEERSSSVSAHGEFYLTYTGFGKFEMQSPAEYFAAHFEMAASSVTPIT